MARIGRSLQDLAATCGLCEAPAVPYKGRLQFCAKHARFRQMQVTAERFGKVVPTLEQLSAMVADVCVDCGVRLHWLAGNERATMATLQHYRDGTLGIVCHSCNSRHASMPGDTYRDMPKDHKRCPRCELVKQFTCFSKDSARRGPMKLKSWCKACSGASRSEWVKDNKDRYNANQREYRARGAQRPTT